SVKTKSLTGQANQPICSRIIQPLRGAVFHWRSQTAIHASRSGNDTLKDQVANKADNRPTKVNVCFRRLSLEEHEKWTVLSNCSS
ncbi:MAG: hypothetical protein ACI9HB_003211, partial [Gammaproteobacteria bacterium]